ncbi:major facilitator superfamily transporter [Colletotrichum karsti]|uniref:Major facilitator superfamily transporter n=1 Tax=Colletotrichum karsti TaxID=1095194 RepID=A0A9P6LFX1_9PEZI|nr:major facilitator superfamily transporter [Colletotrichum karsti]KAF9874574.1 major facilitator superfamily transporter [Colletotrichum karsti]
MDTVPPHIPLTIDTDAGVVRGRGACDDKGPMAAQIFAVEELRQEGKVKKGDVSFLFVVGEEKGGPGMIAANDMNLTWEAGIFGEPTEGKLGKGHKGHLVFELTARGKACHSGYPHLGINAISLLLQALVKLDQVQWPCSDLLGPSTFNMGQIEGGEGYNVVAPDAKALCAVRVAASLPQIKEEITAVVAECPGVEVEFKFEYPETLLDFDFEGFESMPVSYGTDVPRLKGYDVSNTANIQPPIYEAFGQVHLLSWVAIAYTAMNVAMVPLARRLAVLGNLRYQVVVYCLVFVVGSAVSGAAPNINSVIIGRAIQGIGGAGLYQLAIIINTMVTTSTELARTQGLTAVSWAIGLMLGPVIGGAFAENQKATWRWAMYINLPVLAVIIVCNFLALPNMHAPNAVPMMQGLRAIDWAGVVLHVGGFILLCSALIFSGSTWEWSSHSTIIAWVFVGVIYIVYILQQKFCLLTSKERRNIPADILKNRTVILICVATSAVGGCYGIALYYTPLFFAFTKGFDPVDAAVRLLPFIFTFIFFTIITAGIVPVIGRYAPFYVAGGALTIIGGALQAQITATTSESRVMGVSSLIGAGVGCMWQTGVAILMQSVPANRRLDATAMFIMFQLAGVSITLAMAGCIFQNVGFSKLKESLGGSGFSDHDIREALAGLDSKVWSDTDPRVTQVAVGHVADVIANNQYLIVACGIVAFLSGCFMKWEKLDFGRGKQATK